MKGRDHIRDVAVGRNMILKWVLKKQDLKFVNILIWRRYGPAANSSEKREMFPKRDRGSFDYPSDYELVDIDPGSR
jgi:hypothetical protein